MAGIDPDMMGNLEREKDREMVGSEGLVHLFCPLKQTVKPVGRCISAVLQRNVRTTVSLHRTKRGQLCCGMKV